ncbi:MAG: PEGA domain-containing protein [Phycisphaera sp.]|nr:PEGA domain-containing protein [Phycisphaera sp.]
MTRSTVRRWSRDLLGRILSLGLFVALIPSVGVEASPQVGSDPARGIGKGAAGRTDSLAVAPIEVSAAIETAARADGRAEALARFESVLADRLGTTLAGTRKFTMVARDRLVGPLLDEQAFAGTALVNPRDPATAKAMKIAGVRWLAVPRIVDFQDITRERRFEGIDRVVARRTIRAVVAIDLLDSTTGIVGDSASVTLDSTDMADENTRARPKGGDPTNALIDQIAEDGAARLSCRLLDVAYPVRVLAVSGSTVTIDRGDGGCLAVGDRRVVSARGAALKDPDTGEVLGYDEADIGILEISRLESRLARAQLVEGSARTGDVLRPMPADGKVTLVPSGTLAAASGNGGSAGSAGGSVFNGADLGTVAITVRVAGSLGAGDAARDAIASAGEFQSAVVGAVAGKGVRVVDSSLIVVGSDAEAKDRSPLSMAEAVGAQRLLVVDLANIARNSDSVVAPGGRKASVERLGLTGSWNLSSVSDGASLAGRPFEGGGSKLQTSGGGSTIDVKRDLLPEAFRAAAADIAGALAASASGLSGPRDTAADSGFVAIAATLDGLVVPEISRNDDGAWIVESSSLPVLAGGVEVSLDGFVVGTTPSVFEARKGPHQLTLTRQGVETWTRSIRVLGNERDDPQMLTVGLRLAKEARDRYLENAKVVEGLKAGAALTAAQVSAIEGFAKFLGQSGYRVDRRESRSIDIESDQVPEVMQWNSFWNRW